MTKPVTIIIAGCGGRGSGYSQFALEHPDRMKVIGVAEPIDTRRNRMVQQHKLDPRNVFADWRQLAQRERFADGAIVATQDAMHAEPAVAFAARGYHMLLEKPMAPTEADCRRIVQAVTKAGILFAVCHVLRYTSYTRKLKAMVDSGLIGEVVSLQHLEPVGYWHQAHSFVRGNWRNEKESSCMLLAKSCHDLDWISHIMAAPCRKVSSFGSLRHFRKECQPAGAASRCLDCGVEPRCPYSARKIYLGRVAAGHVGWPVDVITEDTTVAGVTEALRSGPYGRCVYECDNDVVDHQVVNMLFDGERTAAFTMTAFCQGAHRRTRLFGTMGEIYCEGPRIEHFDFLTDKTEVIDAEAGDPTILGGHGGGDYGLMTAFIDALATGDKTKILSGPAETLESHLMVFAAERARVNGTVEDVV